MGTVLRLVSKKRGCSFQLTDERIIPGEQAGEVSLEVVNVDGLHANETGALSASRSIHRDTTRDSRHRRPPALQHFAPGRYSCSPPGQVTTRGTRVKILACRSETCQNRFMRPSQALASKRSTILALAAACGASRVRVFGSVARGDDREGSDLDLLVDLPTGTSLLHIVGLQLDIEDALGVKVDLCTERELHPDLKLRILAEARPL